MKKKIAVCLAVLVYILCSTSVHARPTGAALFSYPVEPCRILDTRVSLGALQGGFAMDVHVRGNHLLASEGAAVADCDVPPEAEAVVVNITVVQPSNNGYLKVSGTGTVNGVHGSGNYSRLTFRALENDSNEMQIALCNYYIYPGPQLPCGYDTITGRYEDFQILSKAVDGSTVHIVADVVGYLSRYLPDSIVPW
jgi:hypothetical protein